MMKKAMLLGAMFASFLGAAVADDRGLYLYPHWSTYQYDDVVGIPVDDDSGYGLGFGYRFDDNWSFEVEYNRIETVTGVRNVDTTVWHYNMMYRFGTEGNFRPFVLFGIGDTENDFEFMTPYTAASTSANLGAGFEYAFNDALALRADIRGMYLYDHDANDAMGTVGLVWKTGGVSRKPVDSDADGVIDAMDKCPGTLAGVSVDSNGCELDGDQDGVVDRLDQCPQTLAGVKVDAKGCALDDDKDGVPNHKDQCPATPAGAEVDEKGCRKQLKETVRISLDVKFATNSSLIDPKYVDQVKQVADFMRRFPDTKVVIEGHTDSVGPAKYNKWLSQRRAEAVAQYLVEKFGIDAKRVSAIGYGEERPIADNNTADGRAKNRRVVAAISATFVK